MKKNLDYDTCREGYIKSYYDYGYFGCVKYGSCEATNPRYIDVGGESGCIECEAGGCADYEMTKELGVGAICKVNYKDPQKTTPCEPYRIARYYYPNGVVSGEEFYRMNLIKGHSYDEQGNLISITEYENTSPVREYYADGTLKKKWSREHGGIIRWKEYDREGNLIFEGDNLIKKK